MNIEYKLGYMYHHGEGVEKDLEEAEKWMHKAAAQGNAKAQFNLGEKYYNGDGVDKDLQQAEKWLQKAAEQGEIRAKKVMHEITGENQYKTVSEESQTIEILCFLLLIFPIWWLIAGVYFNCSSKQIIIISIVTFAGGMIGFFIAFACNGGAGGSSEMSASAWGCLLPYNIIQNIILALVFFSGQRKPRQQRNAGSGIEM